MKIIHTADLHLGQVIYQNYDRVDEHRHFFDQLENWCKQEQPDALIVSGDVFDIQQPSANTKKAFTDYFVNLHKACPTMHMVITAGNHDSASRIQADSAIWELANAHLIGTSPSLELLDGEDGWQDDYIIKLDSGYIIAMPYMIGERKEQLQSILDRVAKDNTGNKPVVMMGHLTVTNADVTGHDYEIGKIKTQDISTLGTGYDYLALGHIHKPQTIGHPEDAMKDSATYPSGAVRYSGSVLHVSCDETYPHTVSVVEIKEHGADVHLRQLRIDELRHFYILPEGDGSFNTADEAINAIKEFIDKGGKGYFRLRMKYNANTPANFTQSIYDLLNGTNDEVRFNPKHIWTDIPQKSTGSTEVPTFQVSELQQMTDPMIFIEKTQEQYPGLDIEMVRNAFEEVKQEMERIAEEEKKSQLVKANKKAAKNTNPTEE